uniref:Uncharacterized protein n=1 Tax=Heterorhabditis bacteriophora TaxID=37862 RepID=A0A1I7WR42_HETBA
MCCFNSIYYDLLSVFLVLCSPVDLYFFV